MTWRDAAEVSDAGYRHQAEEFAYAVGRGPQAAACRAGPGEWEAVRGAMTGGRRLPSSVVKASTRQILRFQSGQGRLPTDLFELQAAPSAARLLLLCACDCQQATIERSAADPGRVLLRLQLPARPDPRSYRDWTWVACPLTLPPTVPAGALLHLPAVYVTNRKIRADTRRSQPAPA